MGGEYKKPSLKNYRRLTNENLAQRSVFINKILDIIKTETYIIYIDESSFRSSSSNFKKWILKTDSNELLYHGRLKNVNLILACSCDDVIYSQIQDGNNNSDAIIDYLVELKKIKEQGKY